MEKLIEQWLAEADRLDGPDPETGEEPLDQSEEDLGTAITLRRCADELRAALEREGR